MKPTGGDNSKDRTRRWRSRLQRRVQLFQMEIDDQVFDIAIALGELTEAQIEDKDRVSIALGRLLRRGLVALLEQQQKR